MLHLHRHFDQAVLGEVLYAPVAVVLSQSDVVEPDLVVVLAEHASLIRRARIEGAPDLVAEILSPSTAYRDRGLKLPLYQRPASASTGSSTPSARWCSDTCSPSAYSGAPANTPTASPSPARAGPPLARSTSI